MKISLITVAYNSEKTIRDTFETVLKQTYKDIEYIVVDGLSKDNTLKIIKEYKIKFQEKKIEFKYISEPDKGLYDAMNKGIKMCTGEIIGIINSDDIYINNGIIEKIVNTFRKEKCDSLYSDLVFVDEYDTSIIKRTWKSGKISKFELGWSLPHPTFFVKKKCYDNYGLYNSTYRISSDYDILLRFLKKYNISCYYLPIVTVKMRLGGESTSNFKNIILGNKECIDSWRKNGIKINFYTIPLKIIRKIIQKIS